MKKYSFDDIRKNNLLLYEYIRGSHAYGLEKPDGTSDIDTAGVFIEPKEWLLGLGLDYQEQIADEKNDNVWYSLKKYANLLLSSNPTVLESLFIPERCILFEHPIMTEIKKNRNAFVTKDCFKPFIGYSIEQIKKCRSLHKMFLFEDIERLWPLDFCYTFHKQGSSKIRNWLEYRGLKQQYCGLVNIPNMHDVLGCYYDWGNHFLNEGVTLEDLINGWNDITDYDTIKIVRQIKEEGREDLKEVLKKAQFKNMVRFIVDFYHLRVDSAPYDSYDFTADNLERWYKGQKPIGYKGIVGEDGESNEIRLSSVSKGEMPICWIFYSKDSYSQHCRDWKNQQEWKKNRNPERYKENKGKLFDRKNVAHAVRLLHMGKEIASTGEVNVDRTNIDKDFILGIRLGNTKYEDIISYIEQQKKEMEDLMDKSILPEHIDVNFVNELLIKIRQNNSF